MGLSASKKSPVQEESEIHVVHACVLSRQSGSVGAAAPTVLAVVRLLGFMGGRL